MNKQPQKGNEKKNTATGNNLFYAFIDKNSNKLGWILALTYFMVMTIISFSFHKIGDYGIESDFFGAYVPQANKLAEGIWVIDNYKGPFYVIILFMVNFLFNNYFTTGMIIALLSASLVIFFAFHLLKSLFNPVTAFITTVLLALNTTFHLYTYSAGTDMFFNFLITAALFFILARGEYKWWNLALAGLFSGLAYITRYNGVFILVSIISGLLFINIYKLTWVKRIMASAIYLVVFIAVIAPWGYYTHKEKGKAFWNQNYQNVAYEYLAKDQMGWDDFWYKGNRDKYTSMSQVILQEPGKFFSKAVSNAFDHLGKDLNNLVGWHVCIFSVLGLLLFFSKPPSRKQWAYYLANFLFFGVLLLVFYSERFSLFLIPFYVSIGINALFTENKYLKKIIPSSTFLSAALFIILSVWTFKNSYSYNSENINSGDKNLLKLQKEFNKAEPEHIRGKKIMARKAHVAYYLGLEMTWVPFLPDYYAQVTELWKKKVDYVSYGIWEMGRGLQWLQEPDKLPPDFKLLFFTSAKNKAVYQKEGSKNTYKIDVKEQEQYALIYKVVIDSVRKRIIEAGDWMLNNTADSGNISALMPYFAKYANMGFVELPNTNMEDLLKSLQENQVKYLFFGSYEIAYRPQFLPLADPGNPPKGLKVLLANTEHTNFPFVLFQVE